jgi:hypothetical protein
MINVGPGNCDFTTISLQSGLLGAFEQRQRLVYLLEPPKERVVGLEGFEPPTHGLGNPVALLSSFEKFLPHYIC